MIKTEIIDIKRTLMKTYSTDNKNLHKIGSNEIYMGDYEHAPIDLIDRIQEGIPYGKFIYEETE